jgi:hypothetical protein
VKLLWLALPLRLGPKSSRSPKPLNAVAKAISPLEPVLSLAAKALLPPVWVLKVVWQQAARAVLFC